jgi:hypothetical protein
MLPAVRLRGILQPFVNSGVRLKPFIAKVTGVLFERSMSEPAFNIPELST